MKLENILDKLGSIEKNSFIKIIDNIISKNPKNLKEELLKLLTETNRKTILEKYNVLETKLGGIGASKKTARLIVKELV